MLVQVLLELFLHSLRSSCSSTVSRAISDGTVGYSGRGRGTHVHRRSRHGVRLLWGFAVADAMRQVGCKSGAMNCGTV